MIYQEEIAERDKGILSDIKDKRRKARSKEINVMNKKKLSKWELDNYMADDLDIDYSDLE